MAERENVTGERINLHQRTEVREWSRFLGVTPEALRAAAATVGDRADKVREQLQRLHRLSAQSGSNERAE